MTTPFGKVGRAALWGSPVVIVVAGFVAAVPWLKQQSDAVVLILGAAAGIFVMGYAHFLAHRVQQRFDEVQIAGQGFAMTRGSGWGTTAAVLLLLLPPVTNPLIDLANTMSTGSPDMSDRGAVRVALVFGLILVVLVQSIGVFVASAIWERRMGRS